MCCSPSNILGSFVLDSPKWVVGVGGRKKQKPRLKPRQPQTDSLEAGPWILDLQEVFQEVSLFTKVWEQVFHGFYRMFDLDIRTDPFSRGNGFPACRHYCRPAHWKSGHPHHASRVPGCTHLATTVPSQMSHTPLATVLREHPVLESYYPISFIIKPNIFPLLAILKIHEFINLLLSKWSLLNFSLITSCQAWCSKIRWFNYQADKMFVRFN